MASEGASCRLLQELNHGIQFRQLPAYAYSEVAQIHREIAWRFNELKEILARQRSAMERLIQRAENGYPLPPDALAIVEYPYFALWVHISAIQQLKRALNIYKHERIKWINQVALERLLFYNPSTGGTEAPSVSEISPELVTRLSPGEQDILRRMQHLAMRYGVAMAAVISGQKEKTLAAAAGGSFGSTPVLFPDRLFRQRMGRLAKLDNSSRSHQWCFRNVALPQAVAPNAGSRTDLESETLLSHVESNIEANQGGELPDAGNICESDSSQYPTASHE